MNAVKAPPTLPAGLLDGVPHAVIAVIENLPPHRLLKTSEVAGVLRVTTKTVIAWCEAGDLTFTRTPGVKGPGAHRIYRASVIRMLIRDCQDSVRIHRITTAGGSPPDTDGSQPPQSGGDTLPAGAPDERGT